MAERPMSKRQLLLFESLELPKSKRGDPLGNPSEEKAG